MASTKDHVDFSFCPSGIQIKYAARRKILEAWQQRWSGSSNASWTYSMLSKVDTKRIYGDFFLSQVFTCNGVFPCHQANEQSLVGVTYNEQSLVDGINDKHDLVNSIYDKHSLVDGTNIQGHKLYP
ncbi:hypothetical protein AVEN_171765-1 [Araneus ventricosus]|uniref:Uncharacterized protein n=1 Tax=Araneus ventricosus TaxID=182803 RepID=A0A4Y2WRX4_ARAVE|nr:hypothetical protein AVEN_171765-1 [Araneus ventricosus]